jgi:formylmethanofuran dehydrogenase subunit E
MRTHTSENPFTCTFCDKGFAKNRYRVKHETEGGYPKKDKSNGVPFTCRHCGEDFSSSSKRYKHEKLRCPKKIGAQ